MHNFLEIRKKVNLPLENDIMQIIILKAIKNFSIYLQ